MQYLDGINIETVAFFRCCISKIVICDGEVLFNNTNSTVWVCKTAVYRGTTPVVCSNHVTRLRLIEGVQPEFIADTLNLLRERGYFARLCTNFNNQAGVNSDTLAAVRLPFPDRAKREKLLAALDAAREQRRAKIAEADALLASLDDYLLATLKLTPPPPDTRKVFAVRHAIIPNRFDPHFYSPELMRNQRMLAEAGAETLGSQISFSTEIWKPETHDEPVFRYIEISSVSPQTGEAVAEETAVAEAPSRARMMVRTGDIIVSLTRPHHGSIAQITPELDGCIASTGFAVLRNVGKRLDRDYLWCILRSSICLKQMQQRASGGNYPAITEHELANVAIPVPPIPVQTAIAAESRRRRETARTLRAEAESLWHSAKQEFERQLLGSRSIASQ